jgi:hypothetical protein
MEEMTPEEMAEAAEQRRTRHVQLLQALLAETEQDCAGIADAAAKLVDPTPEAKAAWDQKLADYQARAAALRDLFELLMACPTDPGLAHNTFEQLSQTLATAEAKAEELASKLAQALQERDEFKEAASQNLKQAGLV